MRTVGEILSEARNKKGLSLKDVEERTRIRKRVLIVLEKGDYANLPPTYIKGLLKNYASFLGVDEERVLAFFRREYDEKKAVTYHKPIKLTGFKFRFTPAIITTFFFAAVTLGIIGYLFVQYRSFTAAPKLEIQEPANNLRVSTLEVNVIGQTWSDATLKINGEDVQISAGGAFSVAVGLKEGINTLTITASNRFGKVTTVTRTVIAEVVARENPTASKTDLKLTLEISKSTQVKIEVDGETQFDGLMLAGSKKEYTAAQSIKIKTENAGSTKVVLDGQEIIFGKEGETVDKEFTL